MVTVIHKEIDQWHDRIKNPALYPAFLQFLHKMRTDEADRTDVIIEKTYFHPFLRLLQKQLFHFPETLSVLNSVIFHKNELLRRGNSFHLCLKANHRLFIEDDLRVPVNRKTRIILQHGKLISRRLTLFPECIQNQMTLIQIREKHPVRKFKPLPYGLPKVRPVHQYVQHPAENRHHHDEHHPAHLDGLIRSFSNDIKNG